MLERQVVTSLSAQLEAASLNKDLKDAFESQAAEPEDKEEEEQAEADEEIKHHISYDFFALA